MKVLLVWILAVAALPACLCSLQELKVESCKFSHDFYHGGSHCTHGNPLLPDQYHYTGHCEREVSQVGSSWWIGDTAKMARVKQIRIYNWQDCCAKKLKDFVITVDGTECASYKSDAPFSVKTFNCDLIGTLVKIKSNKPDLTLCELQVFGEPIPDSNPIYLGYCSQSSTDINNRDSKCGKAIDGGTDQYPQSSCSILGTQRTGWWLAHAMMPALMKFVRIHSWYSVGWIRNMTISVDGKECASYSSTEYLILRTFKCDLAGSLIKIKSNDFYMILCEVEVFGKYINQPGTVAAGANSSSLNRHIYYM